MSRIALTLSGALDSLNAIRWTSLCAGSPDHHQVRDVFEQIEVQQIIKKLQPALHKTAGEGEGMAEDVWINVRSVRKNPEPVSQPASQIDNEHMRN